MYRILSQYTYFSYVCKVVESCETAEHFNICYSWISKNKLIGRSLKGELYIKMTERLRKLMNNERKKGV